MTNLKSLIDEVASETEIKVGTVRKVSLALLNKFASLIEKQEDFVSPVITFKSKTSALKDDEDQPKEPQKFARMNIRPRKDTEMQ